MAVEGLHVQAYVMKRKEQKFSSIAIGNIVTITIPSFDKPKGDA